MMFTRRHEQDLAEIKALNRELYQSVHETLRQLQRIRGGPQAAPAVVRPAPGPLIAFVHIPKTAGSTISSMFVRAYSRAGVHDAGNILKGGEKTAGKAANHRVAGKQVAIGHSPYGVLRQSLPDDTRYVTFLREPVNRVLSHYFRHIHRPHLGPAGRSERTEGGDATAGSLEEALVEMRIPDVTNLATRLLCSDPSPMGDLRASALDEAKANLREFTFVGITERSEESIALLQRALGLGIVPYGERRRVSKKRPGIEETTDEQRALIAEHNRLDAELYAFAQELFEKSAAAAGDRLAADVEALRSMNDAVVETDERALEEACEWLERELPPGSRKPHTAMLAAAKAAGISELAFPEAYKALGVQKELDQETGERVWRRPEEARGA